MLHSQPDSLQEEECLHTVDVVTHLEKRWVVSNGIDREWGHVQHRESSFQPFLRISDLSIHKSPFDQ